MAARSLRDPRGFANFTSRRPLLSTGGNGRQKRQKEGGKERPTRAMSAVRDTKRMSVEFGLSEDTHGPCPQRRRLGGCLGNDWAGVFRRSSASLAFARRSTLAIFTLAACSSSSETWPATLPSR